MFDHLRRPKVKCDNRRIVQFVAAFATVLALSGGLTAPAFAEGEGFNTITIYTRTGAIIQKPVTDKAMLNDLLKDAMVIEGGAVMMHEGKWYLIKDHKMPSGVMMLDFVAGH